MTESGKDVIANSNVVLITSKAPPLISEPEFTEREEEILAALEAIYRSCFP